jgi:hypothetical protein
LKATRKRLKAIISDGKDSTGLNVPEIHIRNFNHLPIDKFREMDYLSVQEYKIPVELMMGNAGLQLARLVALIKPFPCDVLIGIGTGNNAVAVWLPHAD